MLNFPRNEHPLPPDMHNNVSISGGKKYLFFGKFDVFCFLFTSVLRFDFLAPYLGIVEHFSNHPKISLNLLLFMLEFAKTLLFKLWNLRHFT